MSEKKIEIFIKPDYIERYLREQASEEAAEIEAAHPGRIVAVTATIRQLREQMRDWDAFLIQYVLARHVDIDAADVARVVSVVEQLEKKLRTEEE
jgi:Rad3-related DNA helicase